MRRCLVLLARMATEPDLAPRRAERAAVRVVAIGARHATGEHLRLQEGAVLVHLVADLPVGVVEAVLEQRDSVGSAQWPAVHVVVGELAAPRGAAPAQLDLSRRPGRPRAPPRAPLPAVWPPRRPA